MARDFQLTGYLRLLAEHDVEYVIVGGVAGRLQGAATTTQDIDIMPEPSPGNLDRLATALSGINTEKKEAGSTSYEPHAVVDAMEFRTADISSYVTRYGGIDVLMNLVGVGTFDTVSPHARRYEWLGIALSVASIDDVITSKEAAGRSKDWRAMDALYEAQELLRQRPDAYEITDNTLDMRPGSDDTDES